MKRLIGVWTVLTLCCTNFTWAATPSFQGLGDLSGGHFHSVAFGVSSDGQVVVGEGESSTGEAFRWTSAGGIVGLGDLSGGMFGSVASAVSSDGQVVVGGGISSSGNEAFLWTSGGGMMGLGDLPGGDFGSSAHGVSFNGQVVVGASTSTSAYWEAFRWTSTSGMVGLGDLPGGNFESVAFGVSSDGSVIAGYSSSAVSFASYEDFTEAFRWTNDGGMVGLGDLPGGFFNGVAYAVSSDGQVIVGKSSSAASFASYEGNMEAFLWTSLGGMVGLGDLPGGSFNSSASAVSADGSIIVGEGMTDLGYTAFIWDEAHGMRNLQDVLVNECHLNLTGWQLWNATGISADGLTIVGYGVNPSGSTEAWVATLPKSVFPCTAPPDFELSVSPSILWPPNGKMIKITPDWTVTSVCDETPEVSLVDITMNESGNSSDIQITDDGSIYLRAERSGNNKTNRIYTLTYEACDESGNCTTQTATVIVPHDMRK